MPTVKQLKDSLLSIRTVDEALNYPTIQRELKHYGAGETIARMFAEIKRGLSAFNVKKNMSPEQIELFIEDFIDLYNYESIADLKIMLKNARNGKYGQHYQSIDGLLLMSWFKQYLDEKAQARSRRHKAEKNEHLNSLNEIHPSITQLYKDSIKTEENENS